MRKFIINSFSLINKSINILIEFISVILSIFFTNHFSLVHFLLKIFSELPPNDEIYAINLSLYVIIIRAILKKLKSVIGNLFRWFIRSNKLNFNFKTRKQYEQDIEDKPVVTFENSMAKLFAQIEFEGDPKILKKHKIEVNLPLNTEFAKVQCNNDSMIILNSEKNSFVLDLNKLNLNKKRWKDNLTIEMVILQNDEIDKGEIEVLFKPNYKLRMTKKSNNILLKG
ncbi:hypothetical protein QI227_04870 [Staphylococcus saprophyticus]|nr:hypothetical protein [Staphylococcus saprophyticus]MDW4138764.1 hypothetical protein [Staphylococcus saprophyticus]MDW4286947.1 hypothetical protein [Staphylococcus saprophyticus]